MSPSSAGAWVAPLPVTAGIFETKRVDFALRGLGVAAGSLDQAGRHALLVVEQSLQQMRGRDPLMMLADRNRLGRLQEPARTIGQFLKVHESPFCLWAILVWPLDHTRASVSLAEVGYRALVVTTVAQRPPSGRGRPALHNERSSCAGNDRNGRRLHCAGRR